MREEEPAAATTAAHTGGDAFFFLRKNTWQTSFETVPLQKRSLTAPF